jgi:hypothetical protein
MGARDVVSLAVRHDNRVVRGVAVLDRPAGALATADGRAKRDRDCQTMGSSPNFSGWFSGFILWFRAAHIGALQGCEVYDSTNFLIRFALTGLRHD